MPAAGATAAAFLPLDRDAEARARRQGGRPDCRARQPHARRLRRHRATVKVQSRQDRRRLRTAALREMPAEGRERRKRKIDRFLLTRRSAPRAFVPLIRQASLIDAWQITILSVPTNKEYRHGSCHVRACSCQSAAISPNQKQPKAHTKPTAVQAVLHSSTALPIQALAQRATPGVSVALTTTKQPL